MILLFICCIFTAMGTGRSKKEAKHAAAKAVLDKLIVGSQEGTGSDCANSTLPEV
jgi:RISC-loading complex subunit TARBP2